MIKTPKLGQKVFYVDLENVVLAGKISQVFNDPSIGVDNFFYLHKEFAFPSRKKANEYVALKKELEYITTQKQYWAKQKEKYEDKLNKVLKR